MEQIQKFAAAVASVVHVRCMELMCDDLVVRGSFRSITSPSSLYQMVTSGID